MRKLLLLLLAACLLTGCSSKKAAEPKAHTVTLDTLSMTVPKEFSPMTLEAGDQQFMYQQNKMFICGYKENKQELMQYLKCETYTLGSYIQTFTESFYPDASPVQVDAYWIMDYTDKIDGVDYSYLCVFYETEEHFWRVMGWCPTEQFEENREYLQNILTSAK